ncbi:MAG: hypothetical protein AB7Q37_04780 [Pyrinomonadaceae bacterium]
MQYRIKVLIFGWPFGPQFVRRFPKPIGRKNGPGANKGDHRENRNSTENEQQIPAARHQKFEIERKFRYYFQLTIQITTGK